MLCRAGLPSLQKARGARCNQDRAMDGYCVVSEPPFPNSLSISLSLRQFALRCGRGVIRHGRSPTHHRDCPCRGERDLACPFLHGTAGGGRHRLRVWQPYGHLQIRVRSSVCLVSSVLLQAITSFCFSCSGGVVFDGASNDRVALAPSQRRKAHREATLCLSWSDLCRRSPPPC